MNCSRATGANAILSKQSASAAAQVLRALNGSNTSTFARPAFVGFQNQLAARQFSTSRPTQWKDFFPERDTKLVKQTAPAWPHPIYTEQQMNDVIVARRDIKTFSDRVAVSLVKTLRWGLDLFTYDKRVGKMTEKQYMIRNVFLESVAGVPGMVAGMLRHLHSMRRMKRDNGWIETLLEESYNERMHLLTFLKMAEPGLLMRAMVLATQGVFFNAFFISYLISPKICHRFVGFLEEEAVITYTRQLEDLDAGRLPIWEKMQAPDIAIKYWNMPERHRSMRDLLLYIRADESKHREVNHTLGNLDQKNDPNPYVSEYRDPSKPHPTKDLAHQKPTGWERDDVI